MKNRFFEIFKTKMPLTSFFFAGFDKNAQDGSASDGESESVLILKNSFCTVGQKSIFEIFMRKTPLTLSVFHGF